MPSTMLSPGTPPRLPSVPGVVLVLARTGADSPCRCSPAVVLAGVAFEVPGVRNVARAGGFAETRHVDELVADRAVALHDQIVRLRLRARLTVFGVSARFTALPGCTARRTPRGMKSREKNPIVPSPLRFGRSRRAAGTYSNAEQPPHEG